MYIPVDSQTIRHIDDQNVDVWKLDAKDPSCVNVQGETKMRPDLRCSKTIRNKFQIRYVSSDITCYFEKIHIGIGNMHVYEPGDFMKEHVDQRSADCEGLPHVMTLVISDDMSPLRINGNVVNSEAVLFSLDCRHEVLPVKQTRRSFVFPVYGIYNPFYHRKHDRINCKNIYDAVLKEMDMTDPESDDLRMLIGAIRIIGIDEELLEALHIFNGGCDLYDEYNNPRNPTTRLDSTTEFYVNYTVDDVTHREKMTPELKIPAATNITFEKEITHPGYDVFEQYRVDVINAKANEELRYAKIYKQECKELPEDAMRTLPNYPVIIVLSGRYFSDSTIESLTPKDKAVYDLVSKTKKVHFSIATDLCDYDRKILQFNNGQFTFANLIENDKLSHLSICGFTVEFNDENAYVAKFQSCYGVLFVG